VCVHSCDAKVWPNHWTDRHQTWPRVPCWPLDGFRPDTFNGHPASDQSASPRPHDAGLRMAASAAVLHAFAATAALTDRPIPFAAGFVAEAAQLRIRRTAIARCCVLLRGTGGHEKLHTDCILAARRIQLGP